MKRNAIIRIIIWSLVILVLSVMLFVMLGTRIGDIFFSSSRGQSQAAVRVTEATSVETELVLNLGSSFAIVNEDTDFYSSPSTEAMILGHLSKDTVVEIIKEEQVSGKEWAYLNSPQVGWILKEFVTDTDTPNTTAPTLSDTVSDNGFTVYASPDTESNVVAILDFGTAINITRRESISGLKWAYITAPQNGWVLVSEITQPSTSFEATPNSFTVTDNLNIRSAPSKDATVVASLYPGDTVQISTQQTVNGTKWAFITSPESGWIVMDYVAEGDTVHIANANEVMCLDAGDVQDIEIEWAAGSIQIIGMDMEGIQISESSVSDPKYKMVYERKGGKISIDYCEESLEDALSLGLNSNFKKDLTIYVPKDWGCNSLEIDAGTATVEVRDLEIGSVEVDTASGLCMFYDCTVDTLELDTASGDIYFDGKLNVLECDAASASICTVLENVPKRMELETMSGYLEIALPETAGFTLTMDSLSGDFKSEFETTLRNNSYISGNGSCRINVDAMSGDVFIRKVLTENVSP